MNIYTLRSVVIPENVTSIAHYGLAATNLKKIRFLGDCSEIHESAFTYVTANAYYPDGNTAWDTGKLKNYGGNLTWKVQCGDGHNYVNHICSECGLIGGTCGTNLTWKLEEGVLILSGSGAMQNYSAGTAPWYGFREQIPRIQLTNELTSVGSYAFDGCTGLKEFFFRGSAPTIGTNAFRGITAIGRYVTAYSGWTSVIGSSYGGTIHRSIGYIAWQNRSAFAPGTGAYDFVWEIIHHVYGDRYDEEYQG